MTVDIAIVEDDEAAADRVVGYCARYERESGDILRVTRYADGDELVSDYEPRHQIIFLDIEMKRMDGMRTAEYVRKMDKDVILIFITNMAQYAIKGYAVDALDFLLKPVPYFAFSQQIKRSIERLKTRQTSYLLLPTENGVFKQDVSRIVYIESFKHKMLVHTDEETFALASTMKELESRLLGKNFFRCNNCYLVNLAYVRSVNGSVLTAGRFELIISRPRRKAFMEALAGYVGGLK